MKYLFAVLATTALLMTACGGSEVAESASDVKVAKAAAIGNMAALGSVVCGGAPTQSFPNQTVVGTAGIDTLIATQGNDSIDGGTGTDTLILACPRASYTLSKATTGWTIISVAEGTDRLVNVERIQFADITVALDIDGTAGQAYRVYQAAFNRTPDNDGLKYWIDAMDGGASLQDVAAGFVNSAEFVALYGANSTNADFLTHLYSNVLHRTPDAGGYNWWLNTLNTAQATKTSVLMGFSESPENRSGVLNAIQNGIQIPICLSPKVVRGNICVFRVSSSSYRNWKEIGLTATVFPQESYIGGGQKAPTAYGFADFFQTGTRDLFTANIRYLGANGNVAASYETITNDPQYHSDFQFWHLNTNGTYSKKWEQKGCKSPRKALVADFNGDGYPDVFIACHDIASETGMTSKGEYSYIVLSDGRGGFNATPVPNTLGYYHGATAADFNGDGYPDIFLSNSLLLINNKNGTFTPTSQAISAAIFPEQQAQYYSYESVDIDDDGNIDLIAGGDEQKTNGNPLNITTAIFFGDGTGHFNRYIKIPTVPGRGLVMDFTVVSNNGAKSLYIARTSSYDSGLTGPQCYNGSYCTNTLQFVNLSTMQSVVILDLLTPPQTWNDNANWMPWWLPIVRNGVNGVGSYYGFSGDNLTHFISH
jgi:hypothetical protein